MLPAGGRPTTSWVHYTTSCNTQSTAPEDGQNNCPKHVELIGIINKPLLFHLVGCLYYLYFHLRWSFSGNFSVYSLICSLRISTLRWSSENIYLKIKSVEYAAHVGERKGICRVLARKPEGKRPLGRPRHR